ncbi:hypothetical protein phiOC_p319 [Ochrobactrum phage vB_OspM_OC]|nr:hypothetical protein phiOC_p319 [Ochrobactrum phage vB_OspM_OC]
MYYNDFMLVSKFLEEITKHCERNKKKFEISANHEKVEVSILTNENGNTTSYEHIEFDVTKDSFGIYHISRFDIPLFLEEDMQFDMPRYKNDDSWGDSW